MANMFDNSEVMTEFYKIASDEKKEIEEKIIEVEEDIVEEAHPEPEYTAEALGDGALVENQNEQQEKDKAVVNKMPHGTPMHEYAACFYELIALADECEKEGELEAAEIITQAAEKVLDRFPF